MSYAIRGLDYAKDYGLARSNRRCPNSPHAFSHMKETTKRRLLQLFLARILILNFLIEEAQRSPAGFQQKEHRRLWTLLQVQPNIIEGSFHGDIFRNLPGFFLAQVSVPCIRLFRQNSANFATC